MKGRQEVVKTQLGMGTADKTNQIVVYAAMH